MPLKDIQFDTHIRLRVNKHIQEAYTIEKSEKKVVNYAIFRFHFDLKVRAFQSLHENLHLQALVYPLIFLF